MAGHMWHMVLDVKTMTKIEVAFINIKCKRPGNTVAGIYIGQMLFRLTTKL